jgi:ribose transport system permease protein
VPSDDVQTPRQPWVSLLLVAVAASIGFALLSDRFLTAFNIYVILSSATLLALIGFSQMIVLGVGEFSLAVGAIGELVGVVTGYMLVTRGVPLAAALVGGLAFGTFCGLVNGVLVGTTGVGGFVITLATGGGCAGVALATTETVPYTGLPPLLNLFGTGRLGPIPYVLVVALIAAAALGTMYHWRRTGRMMLAVGGNPEAAELSGLSKTHAIIWAHSLSGLLAGAAGVVAMAQLHEANPSAGTGWLIQSFTIPIIGGTLLTGGELSIIGILVASLILATINDGLILVNVNPIWITLVEGVLIFLAVLLGRSQNLDFRRIIQSALRSRSVPAGGRP